MISFFEQHASLLEKTPQLAEDFQSIMSFEKFPKHHIIHSEGSICNHIYIIISGIARVFYYKDGRDTSCYFAAEKETITAIDSFIQRKKSKYYIETLEEVEAFKISHLDLENLFQSHPEYERFGRLFMQQNYIELAERIDDLQLKTAQERYETLVEKKPHYLQRISLKHIATFLNITPETLSRIRGK
ncbi:Crp/Fnr family transcriptional regulator [Pseudotenacibaculum sp. MALMAid0570]|uniref:Crp/Fnr family transcriptional regulator n=1 Tax=Pseudotenacibaculum sp. MALMAid0570 TaxID=3143938 RepID=UPI0032E00861